MKLLVVLTVGFWALVFWAADAFSIGEIATVVGLICVAAGGWLWWELRHAVPDPEDRENLYLPDSWLWPEWEDREDRSTVRHGGLGR